MRPSVDAPTATVAPSVLAAETSECRSVVANVFGYHSIHLTALPEAQDLLSTAQTISCHRLEVSPRGRVAGAFAGELFNLPVQNEAVALVVLQHVHELFASRHGLWAELHRVLRPGGIAVMMGLNRRRGRLDPQRHYLAPSAMAEQLRGYDMQTLLVRPLAVQARWMADLVARASRRWAGASWLGRLGPAYLLVARKATRGSPVFPLSRVPLRRRLDGAAGTLGNVQGCIEDR